MKTINPLLMIGTYLGFLAGLFLNLSNYHPFWWVAPFFGVKIQSLFFLDIIGGMATGYTLHILVRIFSYHTQKISNKK